MTRRAGDLHLARNEGASGAVSYASLQLATGTVVNGKVVVEGEPLPEGAVVTILAREADETFEVPPELEAELSESIAEADRGEAISVDEVIDRLRRIA
jgi:hypothetical protein